MTEKQWYEDLSIKDFVCKHVRAVVDGGAVIEGRLGIWNKMTVTVSMGSLSEGIFVLRLIDDHWQLMKGVKSLALVWDERDWERIDARNLRCGDAVVVDGVLYEVTKASLVHTDYPCVGTDALGRNPIDLRLVSCALRRRAQVPAKPGFYRDTLGEFWARAAKSTDDGPWRSVEPDALDQPAKSDKYMSNLMPLTPVHFVDGRAPEPGDELASVMRVTSKGVTFTTEAA